MKVKTFTISKLMITMLLMVSAVFVLSACATTSMTQIDRSTEASIRDSYGFRTYLQSDNIAISSKEGTVTLAGTVPEASHKLLAEDIAKNITGVKKVDNRLMVEGGTPKEGSDAWLGAKVKSELMKHPDINVSQTDVYVQNKVVTLQGEANNNAEKNLAAEYARNVKGVDRVINQITVAGAAAGTQPQASAAGADDATITSQVRTALSTNRSTSVLSPSVQTSAGIVSVYGVAQNQAQKDLVTKIVSDIEGVQGVNNEMTVAGVSSTMPPQAMAPSAMDDAAITAQVETALDTNTSTADLDATVETNNGIVSLAGVADNQAQKDLVTRIVADISGVRGVDNRLSVEEPTAMLY